MACSLEPGLLVVGPLFSEPMRIESVRQDSPDTWVVGLVGAHTERFRRVTLTSLGFAKRQGILPSPRLIEVKAWPTPRRRFCLRPASAASRKTGETATRSIVVTNCAGKPTLQEPIRDPASFPWHEVRRVQHYWLEVNGMTKPMMVREGEPPYGGRRP